MNKLSSLSIDDPLWFDLLVDNELSSLERARLIDHLKTSGEWKKCAMAFMNSQLLQAALSEPSDPNSSSAITSRPVTRQAAKERNQVFWAIAAMLLGFLIAWAWQSHSRHAERQLAETRRIESEKQLLQIAESIATVQKSQSKLLNKTRELDERTVCLTKVIDNEFISVFETPGKLPDLFLETLVMAGHDVDVSQHKNAAAQLTQRITVRKSPRILTNL